MSYQALLFCLDEKLARVVTQVFSDLDFTVEAVNEPFAAVKKLMAQRYDAVVVDCENEPNATLLFKSARNSNSNQSSLALALVEGQSGVAKAYRIGANLVLTKPINVEQAKGTLRVARGLLRKNQDAATPGSGPAAPVRVPTPAPVAFKPAIQNVPAAPIHNIPEVPEFESTLPAMAASAEIAEAPIAVPVPELKAVVSPALDSSAQSALAASLFEPAKPVTQPAVSAPVQNAAVSSASTFGAASAPAPAKETFGPAEPKSVIVAPQEKAEIAAPSFGATHVGSAPSFGALDDQDSDGSGGSKKMLVIAAIVLVAAALGYFGYTKLSGPSSSAPSIAAPQAATTAPAPVSAKPSGAISEPVSSAAQPALSANAKTPAAATTASAASTEPEVITKKVAPAIVVKTATPKKSQAAGDEAAPQVPNPLAMVSDSDKKLSGLVSSAPTAMPTPTLSTVKISQGVSQGLLIKRIQPRYPQNALSMRIQGPVLMEATINKEGSIANLKVVNGDPVLARAATEAVRQWRYKPYYLNGEPVEIQTQITVNFKLPN
jgi:protein TonB